MKSSHLTWLLLYAFCTFNMGYLVPPSAVAEPFSTTAWREVTPIYEAIKKHPFNTELAQGVLPQAQFRFYTQQDILYLEHFAKALNVLAEKLGEGKDSTRLRELALGSIEKEKQAHHEQLGNASLKNPCPSALLYSSYLLSIAGFESQEVLAAALLPCFWIYLELAKKMKQSLRPHNPYASWVNRYSSAEYERTVRWMIGLTDRLAVATTQDVRSRMLNAFVLASRMEWYFWDAAYNQQQWQPSTERVASGTGTE